MSKEIQIPTDSFACFVNSNGSKLRVKSLEEIEKYYHSDSFELVTFYFWKCLRYNGDDVIALHTATEYEHLRKTEQSLTDLLITAKKYLK